jgi:hypothetical protein
VRKKIIGMSVVIAVLAILCVQSVAAQANAWTDKPQYNPGEKGKLEISMLNEYDKPVSIYNITIRYPWYMYDAKEAKWMGNDTIKGDTSILKTMTEKGSSDDHYYKEVDFTVPSDGRAVSGYVNITFWTSEAIINEPHATYLDIAIPIPASLAGLDTWMVSLIVAVVVCTIILAIVIFLATRRARPYGFEALPPPPKPKAKAE